MPAGVPVATVALDGAQNAGLLALRILAASDAALLADMARYQETMRDAVLEKARGMQEAFPCAYR